MPLIRILVAASMAAVLCNGTAAATDEALFEHPDPGIHEFYLKNADEIEALRSRILDPSNGKTRLSTLEQLILKFPYAAEIVARALVQDSTEGVALYAVQLLKGATVMSDHQRIHVGKSDLPRVLHMLEQHNKSTSALRLALTDERPRIRSEVASYLASLSDEPALDVIASDKAGLYSDVEAANIFTLASGEIAKKYLERYIGQGDLEAQRTAITYLGAIPAYQQQIRSKYFLNSDAPTEARVDAARTLSIFDSQFAEYAAPVMANPLVVDPKLYIATLNGYIDVRAQKGDFDPQSAKLMFDVVEELQSSERFSSDSITRSLSTLSQRLEATAER